MMLGKVVPALDVLGFGVELIMAESSIRFSTFPQTEPPPVFVPDIIAVFGAHEPV